MLRQLTALTLALPLLLLSMQGGSMACLPGSVALSSPASSAPAPVAGTAVATIAVGAAGSAHGAGYAAAMHHGMAMDNDAARDRSGASAASTPAAPASPADQHQSPCPDRHSLGSCASMPSCAAIAALPVADGPSPLAAEHTVVAAIPLSPPRAWGAAPELPLPEPDLPLGVRPLATTALNAR